MSHFAPPRADPHGLRAAAGRLTQLGRTLDDRGEHIASVGTAALSSWQGGASLLMVARAHDLRRAAGRQRQDVRSAMTPVIAPITAPDAVAAIRASSLAPAVMRAV